MAAMLRLEGLTKRYGDLEALHELTFDVRDGEVFGFVGANGAGKTTTMRIVLGVLEADAGAVLWNEQPISFEVRRRIGYMPEERGLYPKMRLRDQLEFLARLHGLDRSHARASAGAWLQRLALAGRAGSQLQALSHGNQQRAQLAAALVFDPDLLMLDEPFAGLDPVAVDGLAEVLRSLATAGHAVVFSSHQLDIVERLSDRVGIVDHGRLVACGSVAELTAGGPVRLWVAISSAVEGWTDGLAGVTVVRRDGQRWLLELAEGVDDQRVLRAALAAGAVRDFTRDRPTLTELFRHVVGTGAEP